MGSEDILRFAFAFVSVFALSFVSGKELLNGSSSIGERHWACVVV